MDNIFMTTVLYMNCMTILHIGRSCTWWRLCIIRILR